MGGMNGQPANAVRDRWRKQSGKPIAALGDPSAERRPWQPPALPPEPPSVPGDREREYAEWR